MVSQTTTFNLRVFEIAQKRNTTDMKASIKVLRIYVPQKYVGFRRYYNSLCRYKSENIVLANKE